ncbi:response regulator [Olivibacter ginsenosidimutans]
MAEKIVVLYIDDEENNLRSFKAAFRRKYSVHTALSGEEGLAILQDHQVHVIITDQRMPNMTGVELLEKVKINYPDPIRILLTGYTDMSAVVDAINKGKIYHYLTKPWKESELEHVINKAYDIYTERLQLMASNEQLTINNDQLEFLLRQKLLS